KNFCPLATPSLPVSTDVPRCPRQVRHRFTLHPPPITRAPRSHYSQNCPNPWHQVQPKSLMSPVATVAPSQKSPLRAPPYHPRRPQPPPLTPRSRSQASFSALHMPDARLCRCAQPLVPLQSPHHSPRPWVRSSSFLQDQLSWSQPQPIPPPNQP